MKRPNLKLILLAGLLGFGLTYAQSPELTITQKEEFLRKAKVGKTRTLSQGITQSLKASLSDGRITHDASIQDIDEFKTVFTSALGTEMNFKDTYKGNIAAYRLARLLNLEAMVPPSIERSYRGAAAAFTWWVDDVLMTEKERFFAKKLSPDPASWNNQMYIVRVFDQLIYNTDRNLGNLVIDKNWNLHMIDHTRAFRLHKKLREEQNLVRCDRVLFSSLQALDRNGLRQELAPYLSNSEIDALLARRDRIVKVFQDRAAGSGDAAVFYDYLPAGK
jgi:hypothetical protein